MVLRVRGERGFSLSFSEGLGEFKENGVIRSRVWVERCREVDGEIGETFRDEDRAL